MNYQLKNEDVVVTIDTFGAEMTSIKDKNMKEYMWCGDKKYWGRHSPVLFPIVGRLKDDKYTYEGKEYNMGQHGFARDMEFRCTKHTDSEVWFELEANEDTLEKYPFNFKLEIGYKLVNNNINIIWKVTSMEKENAMYFSIGAHPAFLCPIDSESDKTEYSILMNGDDKVIYYFLNPQNGLLCDKEYELKLEHGNHRLEEGFFDTSAYIIENSQVNSVSLVKPNGKAYITVKFDAPLVGIWSPEKKDAPFVCIEPWYGRCDKENFEGTLDQREWGNTLNPGEVFERAYVISVLAE